MEGETGEVGGEVAAEVDPPFKWAGGVGPYPLLQRGSTGTVSLESSGEWTDGVFEAEDAAAAWVEGGAMGWWLSTSKMPKPMPASARSWRTASLTAARRSFESMSARAMTGRTLTRAES